MSVRRGRQSQKAGRDLETDDGSGDVVRGWTPELGGRIEALYERLGGTVAAASKVESRYEQLGKWRYGRARMPFWVATRLCELAGVRLDWLGTGQGPMLAAALDESLAAAAIQSEQGDCPTGSNPAVVDREVLQLVLAARLAKVYGERASVEAAGEIIRTHDHLISLRRRLAGQLDEDAWYELLHLAGVDEAVESMRRRDYK